MKIAAAGVQSQLLNALQAELDKSKQLIASLKTELSDARNEYLVQGDRFKQLAFEATARDFIVHSQQQTIDKQRSVEVVLMEEVERLSGEIDSISKKLEISEDITHLINHDVRSAIITWLNTTDLLLAEAGLSEEGVQILREARTSGEKILGYIDMHLPVSKLEYGSAEIEFENFNAVDVVLSVIAQNKKMIADKKLSLPPPVEVHGDVAKMCTLYGSSSLTHIIINNILLNAIEASPVGAEIKITFEMNDHCKISIHNLGEVPEKIRDIFFDKFVTSGKRNGTGIGTYSAMLMAKAHNGDILADFSEPGATTVTILFQKPPEI